MNHPLNSGVVCAEGRSVSEGSVDRDCAYAVSSWFEQDEGDKTVIAIRAVARTARRLQDAELLVDRFTEPGLACAFFRSAPSARSRVCFRIEGEYRAAACGATGWLLLPTADERPAYWLPQAPRCRSASVQGHILAEGDARWVRFSLSGSELLVELEINAEQQLDVTLWRLAPQSELRGELSRLAPVETQGYFLWGSHTAFHHPGDLYLHLVHGWVYENRFAWPHRRRICSENDAHALFVMCAGLERATGKRLYSIFKRQLLLSVLARQGEDGGWRHGEWANSMEAHFRLNASAVHLLMDALAEQDDAPVRAALGRAAQYLSAQRDELDAGAWFLHDELELSEAAMASSPFAWLRSKALGKSVSNMLVLNTHLDTTIALDRYAQITGDCAYAPLVASARSAAKAVLALRPAEWLYRLLFRAISLTLLPSAQAAKLPLALRAVKRFAWKYLIPHLHQVKTRFPRLVMPGGYIDRAVPLESWAFHYLTINIMDLLRYQRRFPEDRLAEIIEAALNFTETSGVLGRWRELSYEKYALGFWAEALYHACTASRELRYRDWLAQALALLDDAGMGAPPSLLGSNCEAVPIASQQACLAPYDSRFRVVNLCTAHAREFIVVNTAGVDLPCELGTDLVWVDRSGRPLNGPRAVIPGQGWIRAIDAAGAV